MYKKNTDENGLGHEVPVPKEMDYHGHPNYNMIYLTLIVLLGISLLGDLMPAKSLLIALVFGTAIIKAALVIRNFMHLKYENLFLWIISIGAVLFILLAFFWGMYPDFPLVKLELAPK